MMTTYDDIHDHVTLALGEYDADFDAAAITEDLIKTYDLTGDHPTQRVNDLGDEFWLVVYSHAIPQDQ